MQRSILLAMVAGTVGLVLTLALWPFLGYRTEWYIPGALIGATLMLAGIFIYKRPNPNLKLGSFFLETGALALSVGWIGGLLP
jgi:4-hydroxybenzoate polyprenyltransferase